MLFQGCFCAVVIVLGHMFEGGFRPLNVHIVTMLLFSTVCSCHVDDADEDVLRASSEPSRHDASSSHLAWLVLIRSPQRRRLLTCRHIGLAK